MNLNHVFLFSSQSRIAAIKTGAKGVGGSPIGFSTSIGKSPDSEFQSRTSAMRDMVETLGLEDIPVVIVSFNAERDRRDFAKAFPFDDCIWLDIYQLAWPLVMHIAVSKDRKFQELCAHFGIIIKKEQEGAGECYALCELYWAMMTRYKTSLFGEEVIREAGGRGLAAVRKMFGV